MDISSRNPQVPATPSQPLGSSASSDRHVGANKPNKQKSNNTWYRAGIVAGVVLIVALLIGVDLLMYSNNNQAKDNTESSYIYSNKLQAVFLTTGQVYFGNIKVLNNNFLTLDNIYYLQTNSSSSSAAATTTASTSASNVSLVKLGCELHMPYDQMVINRSQVTFWENLQSNGQVAKAVATFQKEHPNGQSCTDQSSSSASTSNSVQSANTSSTSTNE